MVSGFLYPTPPVASRGKVGRPRLSRGPVSRSAKARQRDEDDDSDFDDGDDVEEGGSKAQGLGFSPTTQYVLGLSFVYSPHHMSLSLCCDLEKLLLATLFPNASLIRF